MTTHIEMTKLAVMLAKANIPFELHTWSTCNEDCLQIASPSKENMVVDAVCHKFSYGGSSGLIEVMGSANKNLPNNDVVGWLTAEDAFQYFKEVK